MAPLTPEEIDVFKIPHSRMKELVYKYCDMIKTTNFSDVYHLNLLLENLIKTFHEFIAHEQIENKYIMKKLKNKLRSLSIQNTAVCNCHKDNQLTDMLSLLEDGYRCTKKSESDRKNYGIKLRHALEDFTKTFLPHMAEEEEVFQPLLMEHFTFEELKQIKAAVLEQHFKVEAEEEKVIVDSKSVKQKVGKKTKDTTEPSVNIDSLPDEVLLNVFSYLNPKDLCHVAQGCKRWNNLAFDPTLWKNLYPVSWANGDWDATRGIYDEESQDLNKKLEGKMYDEDADIDESDDWDMEAMQIQKESKMLTSMCKFLLSRVGAAVEKCDLAYSKGITNGTLYKILSLCPNLEYLDLTQTRVSDLGFKGLERDGCGQELKHLDLTGCLYITDITLQRVAQATNRQSSHVTEESKQQKEITLTKEIPTEKEAKLCKESDKNLASDNTGERDKTCKKYEHIERYQGQDPWLLGCNPQQENHCRNSVQKVCTGCSIVEKPMDCCLKRERDKCNTDVCNDCDRAEKCEDKEMVHCCIGNRCKDNAVDRCQGCWSLQDSSVTSTECGPRRDHVEENGLTYVDQPTFQSCRCESYTQPVKVSTTCDLQPEVLIISGMDHVNYRNDSLTCNDYLSTPSSKPETGVGTLVMEIPDTELTVSTTDQENGTRVVEKNSDTTTNTSEVDKHNRINIEGPDSLAIIQTWLEETDLIETREGSMIIDWASTKEEDFNEKERPDPVLYRTVSDNSPEVTEGFRCLEYLSLSGCFKITDEGLGYLTENGGLPNLKYLDLSGCQQLSGPAVTDLVYTATKLDPSYLFYCDNILDGPFAEVASGCQNLQCSSRMCCRCAE